MSRQGIAVAVIESTDQLAIVLLVFDIEACTRESVGGKLLYSEADRISRGGKPSIPEAAAPSANEQLGG